MFRFITVAFNCILIPCLSQADGIEPLVNILYPDTALPTILITIIIIFIEAILLKHWIKSVSFKTNLWRSMVINFSSSFVGSFVMFFHRLKHQLFEKPWEHYDSFFSFALVMFLITIAVETPILIFLYRKEVKSRLKMFMISLGINSTSYLAVLILTVALPLLLLALGYYKK
jgi:hypothetical protein